MTKPMKELLLREFAQGISAVAKRRDVHIDPMALQCFLYKHIGVCNGYGRSSDKLFINYDGMMLYNITEIAKTPEEAEQFANYEITCVIKYHPYKGKYKPPKLFVEFQSLDPYRVAFKGWHKLSNTLCTMYRNLDVKKRSLFITFVQL